jgi:uncharacterized protein
MQIQCANEQLVLLSERALLWPARHCLLVADAHIGKAAAFRAKGVPVPRGTTAANLALLTRLIATHGVQEIIFLGDFLHAAHSKTPGVLAALQAFRAQHMLLAMTLVRGNHDNRAGDPPASLQMQVVDEPLLRAPFALCHVPRHVPGHYALAGHIHPAVRIASRGQGARLPCFWLSEHYGVLPAFGEFTGTYTITPQAQDRVYAVAGDRVLQVPVQVLAA